MKKRITITLTGLPRGKKKPSALLTLRDTASDRTYEVAPGKPVSVEAGDYILSGSYLPNEDGRILHGEIYGYPPFSVHAQISVTGKTSNIKAPVTYDCFALVLDKTSVSRCLVRGYSGAMSDIPLLDKNGVVFIRGNFSHPGLDIRVTLSDGSEKTYTLVNDPQFATGKTIVENGKWYAPRSGILEQGKIEEM